MLPANLPPCNAFFGAYLLCYSPLRTGLLLNRRCEPTTLKISSNLLTCLIRMTVESKQRAVIRYFTALVASGVALGIIAALNPVVGFTPLLLLGAVALVERYAGARPAILTIVFCSLFSLFFISAPFRMHERVHNVAELAIFPIVAAAVVYLMEARRQQKREIHEQSLELSTLLDSMTEGVFVFDPDGRIVEVNRAGERFMNTSRNDLIGAHYSDLAQTLRVYREDTPVPIPELGVVRALRGEVVQDETRNYASPRDGSTVHAIISASPMRVANDRVIGALLIVRDVTDVTNLQHRVADTERHLAIGQMASGLAHDFNNVLNTITQATALLELSPDQTPEERRRYLVMIDRAARTGAEIIKRVREYVRGGSGMPAAVDVSRIMREAVDLAEPMWRTGRNIVVEQRYETSSPVWANPADLRRVFANLIINAIQAMPGGGKLVVETEEHEGKIFARVRDTGNGIPVDVQKKIFLPYFTTKPTGTGLGLSTAQKILLAQGGNLSFTSDPGIGTVFTAEIPTMKIEETAKVA
jgi:PAS domain S-box-containing protein